MEVIESVKLLAFPNLKKETESDPEFMELLEHGLGCLSDNLQKYLVYLV